MPLSAIRQILGIVCHHSDRRGRVGIVVNRVRALERPEILGEFNHVCFGNMALLLDEDNTVPHNLRRVTVMARKSNSGSAESGGDDGGDNCGGIID